MLYFCYNNAMDYSASLKALREELLLSQMEMAQKLGISYATVNRIENARSAPSLKTKRKIKTLCDKYHIGGENAK
jgi:DNA-binding XRE family transcriptional regulator